MASQVQDELDRLRLLLPLRPDDHAQGSAEACYTLVEYGHYECPDGGRLFVSLAIYEANWKTT